MKKITKITYNNGNIFKFDNTRVFAFITGEENIFEYFKQHIRHNFYMFEKCTKIFSISQERNHNWSFKDLLIMALYNNDPVKVIFDKSFNTYKFKSIIYSMPELTYI